MHAYVRHTISSIATLAVLMAIIFVGSSPAQAAPFVDLTVSDTSINLGETVYLNWGDNEEAETLVASGDWSGNKVVNGITEEAITPAAVGSYTYTITATDSEGAEDVSSVTVEVALPEATEVIPEAVTFPDECTVVIPDAENVTYYVQYGGDFYEPLEPGATPGSFFFNNDAEPVRLFVRANEGFILADGAEDEWFYTASEDCLGGTTLVTTTAACHSVTFTSVVDEPVFVQYGDEDEPAPDGDFELAAGDTRTVKTERDLLYFVAGIEQEFQEGEIDVTTDCEGDGNDHPTVAPAAGK